MTTKRFFRVHDHAASENEIPAMERKFDTSFNVTVFDLHPPHFPLQRRRIVLLDNDAMLTFSLPALASLPELTDIFATFARGNIASVVPLLLQLHTIAILPPNWSIIDVYTTRMNLNARMQLLAQMNQAQATTVAPFAGAGPGAMVPVAEEYSVRAPMGSFSHNLLHATTQAEEDLILTVNNGLVELRRVRSEDAR
jgi:hypothetical protein